MDIKQLESFVCVAKTGSMTAAAQQLYLTPPALAQQMNRLEKEIGVQLLIRSPRGVTLTPAGMSLFEDAQQVIGLAEDMLHRCRKAEQQAKNTVRIGSVKGFVPDYYPEIQRAARKHCPDIHLEHIEDTFDALKKALLSGQIDALEYYDSSRVQDSELQYIPLLTEGRECLMTSDHPLASKERLTPQDLIGEKVYALDFDRVPGLPEYLKARCPEFTLLSIRDLPKPKSKTESGYYATLHLCEGGSISLITPHCARHFSPLVSVPLDIDLTWSSGLICRKALRAPMQTVLSAIHAEFAA